VCGIGRGGGRRRTTTAKKGMFGCIKRREEASSNHPSTTSQVASLLQAFERSDGQAGEQEQGEGSGAESGG